MAQPLETKLTYRPSRKLQVFFTGGAARVSRDGKLLVCACGDEAKVVDVATGSVVRTFAGDSEPITALALSPDCQTLVTASRSTTCRVYNLQTGALIRSWRAHKLPVADMAVDASGGYVATASADRSVKVWDLQGGFCTHSFPGHGGVVLRVAFHPKQLLLFSAGDDSEVRVWDLVEKKCTAVLKGHFSAVTSLSLSPDGWLLLSAGRDKVVNVWDIRTNSKLATVPVYEAVEGVVAVQAGMGFPGVPADDKEGGKPTKAKTVFFATAGEKGRVKLWRSDTGTCVYEEPSGAGLVPGSAAAEYTDLSLLPGGAGLLAITADARLLFLAPGAAAEKAQGGKGAAKGAGKLAPGKGLVLSRQLVGNMDEVTDVRFVGSKSHPSHIAIATNSEAVRLFDLGGLSCVASLVGHRDTVLCLDAALAPPAPPAASSSDAAAAAGAGAAGVKPRSGGGMKLGVTKLGVTKLNAD